ncbi:helix-turn-helix domain-containing protein [Actinomadura rupiterrae]|uniref:helix-turn-helix domain-containing protein n=1 Tax=Actinomadura rupiterrae TaxID=559627 RepID=UPI0020A23E19|nr:helix-turn-helix transcriptional regulator [Actinomadura rupiterrae]MCP2337989.1 transcriptional regulator with XRE-family HTH domain [Actinomadura rupiterrae]
MSSTIERSGVGPQLKHWRSVRRISQLELALLAGTTQRHLSFIESGRSRPGRAIVIRLAESLRLSLRERNDLLTTAGYAPVFKETGLDEESLRPVRSALEQILIGHMPYPALVVAPYGRVVGANDAVEVFTEDASPELLEPPVNMIRLMLHPKGMAPRVRNLDEWGRHVIENLRALSRRSPDARLDEFVEELASYVPEPAVGPDHLGFSVPMRLATSDGELRLITTLTSFATATDITLAELHLEAFLPADQESAELLRLRAQRHSR